MPERSQRPFSKADVALVPLAVHVLGSSRSLARTPGQSGERVLEPQAHHPT